MSSSDLKEWLKTNSDMEEKYDFSELAGDTNKKEEKDEGPDIKGEKGKDKDDKKEDKKEDDEEDEEDEEDDEEDDKKEDDEKEVEKEDDEKEVEKEDDEKEDNKPPEPIPDAEIVVFEEEDGGDSDYEQDIEDPKKDMIKIGKITQGNKYLLVLSKNDKFNDYIGEVIEVTSQYFILNNELDEQIKIIYEDDSIPTILEDGSTIIDIIKIKEVILEEVLDEKDIFKEKEIELLVEEVEQKDKIFNETEIKEDFISELINLYGKYDDELLIKNITEMAYSFFDLIKENKYISDIDKTDVLSFVKNMINNVNFELPKFIIPIVALKKKLYGDEEEGATLIEKNDTIIVESTDKELEDKYNHLTNDENIDYYRYINILFDNAYNSYRLDDTKNGFEVNYDGHIIRDCLNDENKCSGLNEQYYNIDLLKSRKEIYIIEDGEKELVLDEEIYNVIGLLFIPDKYSKYTFNLSLSNEYFLLFENIKLHEHSYSIKTFREILSQEEISFKKIGLEDVKDEGYEQTFNGYMFDSDKNMDLEDLTKILIKNLPYNSDIINSINQNIFKFIYNYKDLERILFIYNISINDLQIDKKNEINEIIKNNIAEYDKKYKELLKDVIKPFKESKIINKELELNDKIKLCLEYIFNTKDIIKRNHFLKKFIKIYTRDSNNSEENNNWLYNAQGKGEQLLCKHYEVLSNINEDEHIYNIVGTKFGLPPNDGYINCKVCGHFICHDNFSTFDGFSEDKPMVMQAVMEEEDIDETLSAENKDLKEKIVNIAKIFNIKLFNNDLENIIRIMTLIDQEALLNFRYGETNILKNDPYMDKLKEKYPINKSKDKSFVKKNAKNKKAKDKAISSFSKYLVNINKLLYTTILIFIHVQISDNVYKMNLNGIYDILIYDLEESWKNLYSSKEGKSINHKLLQYIEVKTTDEMNMIQEKLINKEFLQKPILKTHLINTIRYFIDPQYNLFNMIEKYFMINNNLSTKFTKESWPTYKPLYDNKLVKYINNYVNSKNEENKDYFMNNDSLENISLLKDINKIEHKYIELGLPISDIMNNPSFKRLYMYSLKLYGKSVSFSIIDKLTKQLINTTKDNQHIKDLLSNCGYDNKTFDYKSINYNKFKEVFNNDILLHEIKNNPHDKDNILKFKHINTYNTEYLLLNSSVNRVYTYTPAIIFVDLPYDGLKDAQPDLMNKLFSQHCYDKNGNLIKNTIDENILNYLLLDYQIKLKDNISECKKTDIPRSKENFEIILENMKSKLSFKPDNFIEYTEKYTNEEINEYLSYDTNIEERLLQFFSKNKIGDIDTFKEVNKIIQEIMDNKNNKKKLTDDYVSQELDKLLSEELNEKREELYGNIDELFDDLSKNEYINEFNNLQTKRFKEIIKNIPELKSVTNISEIPKKIIEDIDENNHIYKALIEDIYYTLSRIKNKKFSHSKIRKQWKISDTYQDNFNEYLDVNEFLLHNDLFFPRSKNDLKNNYKYSGFKQYDDEYISIYFEELYNYIKDYNIDLYKLKGSDNNIIDNDYLKYINQFIYLFIINKITEYIHNLLDEESDLYLKIKTTYDELNDDNINIKNNIIYLSRFLLDIIMNMYEKYYDKFWIYVDNDTLNNSIMKQSSREKQTYLKKTSQMSKEQKLLNDLQQEMGTSMLFHESAKENEDFAQSETWEKEALPGGYDQVLYDQDENGENTD